MYKISCLVHCKHSKYLLGTQPLPLCWEQDMTLVENTLLICLFIPSLDFLSVLSVQYAAHPLLVYPFCFFLYLFFVFLMSGRAKHLTA